MPAERFEIRIPALKLLIAMLVLITPICIAGLIGLANADRSLERTVGNHFKTIAEISASEVSRFIHDRVTDVGVMAMEFAIVDSVTAADRSYQGRSDAQVGGEIQKIEQSWNTPAGEPAVNKMLATQASRLLRRHREFDPRYLRITVTDARGATVAATHKTLDYYQADEEFWQNIYAAGRGSVAITDVLYDDVTKANYIGIGVPILEEQTHRFLGVVDALVDVSAIFPAVSRMQFGPTARLLLIKDDGTVIAAPGISLSMKIKSREYAAVREAEQSTSPQTAGFVVADVAGNRNVIGFADTGLKQDYGNLGWLVLSAQDTQEALAAGNHVERLLALMSILGLLAVTLLGVYIFLHRQPAYEHLGEVGEPSPQRRPTSA